MAQVQFNPQGKKVVVPIRHTIERHIDIHLEDGTILTFKPTIVKVERYVDQWDPEGNPFYMVQNGQNLVSVHHAPGDLKQKR